MMADEEGKEGRELEDHKPLPQIESFEENLEEGGIAKEIFAILGTEQVLEDVEEQKGVEEKVVVEGQSFPILSVSCQHFDAAAPGFTQVHLTQSDFSYMSNTVLKN